VQAKALGLSRCNALLFSTLDVSRLARGQHVGALRKATQARTLLFPILGRRVRSRGRHEGTLLKAALAAKRLGRLCCPGSSLAFKEKPKLEHPHCTQWQATLFLDLLKKIKEIALPLRVPYLFAVGSIVLA